MKRKKFLALALAGVMTAVTLTACAPLDALYDWFFGGGSGSASHGSEKGLVTESEELENKLKAYLGLSETTASDKAKETLEAVAKGFDAEWLDNNMLNETSVTALDSITKAKLQVNQQLFVDVMELTSPGRTAVTIPDDERWIYLGGYEDRGPSSGGRYYYSNLTLYSHLKSQVGYYGRNGVELYAGTFQKGEKTYAAMVTIIKCGR